MQSVEIAGKVVEAVYDALPKDGLDQEPYYSLTAIRTIIGAYESLRPATRLSADHTGVLEDLPRLIELQRTAAPEHSRDDGWNAGLDRATAVVREALAARGDQSPDANGEK